MKIGERTIVGEVQPREEAKKTYETARDAGRHAATVEQQRPNLFTTRVANIPPPRQTGEPRPRLEFQHGLSRPAQRYPSNWVLP